MQVVRFKIFTDADLRTAFDLAEAFIDTLDSEQFIFAQYNSINNPKEVIVTYYTEI